MKLGIWSKPDKWLAEIGYDLGQADILEAHRFIYLFFDQNALDNHNFKRTIKGETIYGKAIQINLSISKGGKDNFDLMPWMRKCDNSTHMIASMYTYDTVFDTDITNIYSAKFILNEAMISSTMNDYNLSKAMLCKSKFSACLRELWNHVRIAECDNHHYESSQDHGNSSTSYP